MTRIAQIAALFVIGCIAIAARTASAATLDPFRTGGSNPVSDKRSGALDPFRVAQALPNPAAAETPKPAKPVAPAAKPVAPAAKPAASAPAPASTSTPAAAPAPAPATARKACERDDECGEGSICKERVCQAIELSTNLFPLYYREGAFTESAIIYWARKGNPGYTVVLPFYWHYWSPTSDSFAIAPFYWHFTDSTRERDLKIVLNVSWSRERDARSFGFWPLFYVSNKYGWALPFLLTFNVGNSKIEDQYGALLGLWWWKRSQQGAFDFGFVPPYVSSRDAARAFTWAAPLTFYWRNGEDRSLLALPLFYKNEHRTGNSVYTWLGYSRREGREQSGSALWVYWFGRDDGNKSGYDVLFPLLWSVRSGASSSTVLFPLIWSFSGPKTNTTVVGPFIHRRNDASYANVLFPVWWSVGDDATGRGFKALIPLFVWTRDFKARTSSLFTAAGGYSKD